MKTVTKGRLGGVGGAGPELGPKRNQAPPKSGKPTGTQGRSETGGRNWVWGVGSLLGKGRVVVREAGGLGAEGCWGSWPPSPEDTRANPRVVSGVFSCMAEAGAAGSRTHCSYL